MLGNGHVYAAAGSEGIVKFDGDSWSLVNAGLSVGNENRQWTAVTGYVAGMTDIVYAGANNVGGNRNGRKYSNIWRTEDGARSWIALVDADTNVSDRIHGQSYDWWYREKAFTNAGLGRTNSVVSAVAVSPGRLENDVSDDIVYVSGRGGLWKSENGGKRWAPAVYNMQATSNNAVAVHPSDPGLVALANTDYVVLATNTGFDGDSLARNKPNGAPSKGFDLVFDSSIKPADPRHWQQGLEQSRPGRRVRAGGRKARQVVSRDMGKHPPCCCNLARQWASSCGVLWVSRWLRGDLPESYWPRWRVKGYSDCSRAHGKRARE